MASNTEQDPAQISKKSWPWILTCAGVIIVAQWNQHLEDLKKIDKSNAQVIIYATKNTGSAVDLAAGWERLYRILNQPLNYKDSVFNHTSLYDSTYSAGEQTDNTRHKQAR